MAICWGSWRNEGTVRDSGDGSGVPTIPVILHVT